jgi:hypothetical protein
MHYIFLGVVWFVVFCVLGWFGFVYWLWRVVFWWNLGAVLQMCFMKGRGNAQCPNFVRGSFKPIMSLFCGIRLIVSIILRF